MLERAALRVEEQQQVHVGVGEELPAAIAPHRQDGRLRDPAQFGRSFNYQVVHLGGPLGARGLGVTCGQEAFLDSRGARGRHFLPQRMSSLSPEHGYAPKLEFSMGRIGLSYW